MKYYVASILEECAGMEFPCVFLVAHNPDEDIHDTLTKIWTEWRNETGYEEFLAGTFELDGEDCYWCDNTRVNYPEIRHQISEEDFDITKKYIGSY